MKWERVARSIHRKNLFSTSGFGFCSDISLINLPGGRMHRLSGDRKGYWSLSISRNWRITFRFDGQDITDVDFEDYH